MISDVSRISRHDFYQIIADRRKFNSKVMMIAADMSMPHGAVNLDFVRLAIQSDAELEAQYRAKFDFCGVNNASATRGKIRHFGADTLAIGRSNLDSLINGNSYVITPFLGARKVGWIKLLGHHHIILSLNDSFRALLPGEARLFSDSTAIRMRPPVLSSCRGVLLSV